jgi:hypothetical protein
MIRAADRQASNFEMSPEGLVSTYGHFLHIFLKWRFHIKHFCH